MVVEIEPQIENEDCGWAKEKTNAVSTLKFTNQKGGIEGGKRQKRQGFFILLKKFFRGLT